MKEKKNSCWLFLGPEIGEKQAAVDEIRKNFGEGTGIEETTYYAGETPVSVIVSAMRNGSLFADKRIFFIKSAEVIKKKEELELLSSYTSSPADDTVLILISDEAGSSTKTLEQALPAASKKIFWELSSSRKNEWVKTFFTKEGFRINAEGIETILELVENNTSALGQECSRLILFLDKEKEITDADVEQWLSHTREETVYTLFSRIASGDLSRSIECVRMLLAAKETPAGIFTILAYNFRTLIKYITLKEAGVSSELEYKKINVSAPSAKRDHAAASKRYTTAQAETCLALTAEYDMLCRSSSSFPHQILMDRYLYRIFQV